MINHFQLHMKDDPLVVKKGARPIIEREGQAPIRALLLDFPYASLRAGQERHLLFNLGAGRMCRRVPRGYQLHAVHMFGRGAGGNLRQLHWRGEHIEPLK